MIAVDDPLTASKALTLTRDGAETAAGPDVSTTSCWNAGGGPAATTNVAGADTGAAGA